MSRFSHYDTDEERLPEGMQRVGYDADTQVYTFRDADGSYWESAPGCQYGRLTRVSGARNSSSSDDDREPFLIAEHHEPSLSWRHEMRPLLHFFLLIGLFLVALFWFLHWRAKEEDVKALCESGWEVYNVQKGDTCWGIAQGRGVSVEELMGGNGGLVCERLGVGEAVCVPVKA